MAAGPEGLWKLPGCGKLAGQPFAVHEGGLRVELLADGAVRFRRPDGRCLEHAPGMPGLVSSGSESMSCQVPHVASAIAPTWDGGPVDYNWSIQWLRHLAERESDLLAGGEDDEDSCERPVDELAAN